MSDLLAILGLMCLGIGFYFSVLAIRIWQMPKWQWDELIDKQKRRRYIYPWELN